MSKFKVGDVIVRIIPLRETNGTIAVDVGIPLTVTKIVGERVQVKEDTCAMDSNFLELESVYNSPLYKALL